MVTMGPDLLDQEGVRSSKYRRLTSSDIRLQDLDYS